LWSFFNCPFSPVALLRHSSLPTVLSIAVSTTRNASRPDTQRALAIVDVRLHPAIEAHASWVREYGVIAVGTDERDGEFIGGLHGNAAVGTVVDGGGDCGLAVGAEDSAEAEPFVVLFDGPLDLGEVFDTFGGWVRVEELGELWAC
jgi:hypothetical protein